MGVSDIMRVYPVYRLVTNQCEEFGWPYQFKEDLGSFETAIEFWAMGYHHPPKSKDWDEVKKAGHEIKCPDILDFYNKIIVEFEEESKPGKKSGKLGKKGHTEESNRDSNRDQLYRIAGFRLCKIWECEPLNVVEMKLHYFLADCYTNRDLNIYINGFLTVEKFSKVRRKSIEKSIGLKISN